MNVLVMSDTWLSMCWPSLLLDCKSLKSKCLWVESTVAYLQLNLWWKEQFETICVNQKYLTMSEVGNRTVRIDLSQATCEQIRKGPNSAVWIVCSALTNIAAELKNWPVSPESQLLRTLSKCNITTIVFVREAEHKSERFMSWHWTARMI